MKDLFLTYKRLRYAKKSVETLKNTDLTKMSKKQFWTGRFKYLSWYIPMCAIFVVGAYVAEKDVMNSKILMIFLISISFILVLPAIISTIISYNIWKEQNTEEK